MLLKTEDAVNFLFKEYNILQETMTDSQHMKMTKRRVSSIKLPTSLQNDIQLQERWRRKSPKDGLHKQSVGTLRVKKSDVVSSHIKTLRKEISESMAPVVQKAYTSDCWKDGKFVPELKPFIRKCTFLCWMMVVQAPSMNFHMVDANKDVNFDKNMYKEYTSRGPLIKYVVWPALLLHEDGPMVSKGVAQGYDYS
ncbi:uncharacterized protein LOC123557699 [Mercenaria mercenaria]|uniref:uncharacterized protein LOC123557699 n=1 Tax=Mercenaria mercenaria TaxID=6596 RepID=UPI00234ECB16|nr:uncharacterized protein LOC123557699 [Mercenaria mercenaria]